MCRDDIYSACFRLASTNLHVINNTSYLITQKDFKTDFGLIY